MCVDQVVRANWEDEVMERTDQLWDDDMPDVDFDYCYCPFCRATLSFLFYAGNLEDYNRSRDRKLASHLCPADQTLIGSVVCPGCGEVVSFMLKSGVSMEELEEEALWRHTCREEADDQEDPEVEFEDRYVRLAREIAPGYMQDWQ